jgi:hypothetical protein
MKTSHGRKATINACRQSLAAYWQTLLSAFQQVADCLNTLEHDAQALGSGRSTERRRRGAVLSQANYRAGMVGYLHVLTADVQFHQTTIAYLQAVAQRHQDTVALFVALGGGWWNEEAEAQVEGAEAMKYSGIMRIGFKLLGNDRAKVSAPLIGITFAVFLMIQMTAMFAGILNRAYSTATNIGAKMWIMDPAVKTATTLFRFPTICWTQC